MNFSLFLFTLVFSLKIIIFSPSSQFFVFQTEAKELPEINSLVITFVKSKINIKVGRGECWDLASEALNFSGAKWEPPYIFGKEINYKKEPVFPGDIIQFENIKFEYEKNGVQYTETMLHHTAIIFQTINETNYEIAHQNNGFSGKKVGISSIDFSNIKKGKFKIYRPEK